MLDIVPTRSLVSRRFPTVSFGVVVPARRPFEIACTTDARLLCGDRRALRHAGNFFTSRSQGWLVAPFGRSHYLLPADVVARFAGAQRLYYVLAAYDSPRVEHGMFSLAPAGLARAPYLRLSPDLATHWRPRAPPSRGRAAPSLLAWGGDLPFSGRALDSDGFPDDGEFSVDEEPGTPPATPDAKLAEGQVVLLEVRDGNGAVTRFSHAYPVDPEGKVRIPTVGPVAARDLTLVELREVLGRAFAGIVSGGSVNLTPSSDTVFYAEPIARSTQLYLRILDSQGAVDPSSGAYAVDSQARLHLPRLGDIDTANYTLGQLETSLQRAIDDRVRGTVVNLSKTALP